MWLHPEETADLVTFTEEVLNGKFYFLSSDLCAVANEKLIIDNKQIAHTSGANTYFSRVIFDEIVVIFQIYLLGIFSQILVYEKYCMY